jgi:hypothetical protein
MDKLKLLFLLITFIALLHSAHDVQAQVQWDFYNTFSRNFLQKYMEPTGYSGTAQIDVLAVQLIMGALALIGMVFISLLLYGGFLWLTASGDPERVKRGRDTLQSAFLGLLIVIGGYTITFYIIKGVIGATQSSPETVLPY